MKAQFLLIIILLSSFDSISQVGFPDCRKSTPVFELAEKMPEPAGGMDSLKTFLQREFIPWELQNVTRQLDLDLLVNSDGSACLYMVYVTPYSLSTDKIANSIKKMPIWEPARQNNYKIDCYVKLSLQIDTGVLTNLIYKNSK